MVITRKAMLIDESRCTACRGCQSPASSGTTWKAGIFEHEKLGKLRESAPPDPADLDADQIQ